MLALLGMPEIAPAAAGQVLQQVSGSTTDPTVLLGTFLIVLARIIGFMMVAPFFGSMNIPMTGRVAFAGVLSLVLSPLLLDTVSPALAGSNGSLSGMFIVLLVNQLLVGVFLGMVAAFVFYAIESAGRIIDTQRGSNITDIIAPQSGERTSPTGQWLNMLALAILCISGQHLLLLNGLIDTFRIFPPTGSLEWVTGHVTGPSPGTGSVVLKFASLSGDSLMATLQIAAPAMISLTLADVLLGIINRGAPQVNVFALSQVVKGPIGIAAVMIALIPTISFIEHSLLPGVTGAGSDSIRGFAHLMARSS